MIVVIILTFILGVGYISLQPSLDIIVINNEKYLIVWYFTYNEGYYNREYKILWKL